MDDKHDNPLMLNHWSHTLEALVDWIAINETLSDAVAVRRLIDVIRRAPHPDLVEGLGVPDPATVERLLAVDAADTLVLRLIGSESGFFASRGAAGEYLVSVVLPGRSAEMTASGSSLTRATVCALALTLSCPEQVEHGADHSYAGFHAAATADATLH